MRASLFFEPIYLKLNENWFIRKSVMPNKLSKIQKKVAFCTNAIHTYACICKTKIRYCSDLSFKVILRSTFSDLALTSMALAVPINSVIFLNVQRAKFDLL